MNGLVSISEDEYREFFEMSKDFYYRLDIQKGSSFAFHKDTDLVVAYKDFNGECFARTTYWKSLCLKD